MGRGNRRRQRALRRDKLPERYSIRRDAVHSDGDSIVLFEHDFFQGLVSTFRDHGLGCVCIQVMPACKWAFRASGAHVPKVRSAPGLEIHLFGRLRARLLLRLGLT